MRTYSNNYSELWNQLAKEDAKTAILNTGKGQTEEAYFWKTGEGDAEVILKHTPDNAVVAEIGCGVGRILHNIAPHCSKAIGIDVSEEMLLQLKQVKPENTNVESVLVNNPPVIPYPDKSVDVVYSILCLQHMEYYDAQGYILEANRILKPGGILIVGFPNIRGKNYRVGFMEAVVKQTHFHADRMRYYTSDMAMCFFENAKFTIESVSGLTSPNTDNMVVVGKKFDEAPRLSI